MPHLPKYWSMNPFTAVAEAAATPAVPSACSSISVDLMDGSFCCSIRTICVQHSLASCRPTTAMMVINRTDNNIKIKQGFCSGESIHLYSCNYVFNAHILQDICGYFWFSVTWYKKVFERMVSVLQTLFFFWQSSDVTHKWIH